MTIEISAKEVTEIINAFQNSQNIKDIKVTCDDDEIFKFTTIS